MNKLKKFARNFYFEFEPFSIDIWPSSYAEVHFLRISCMRFWGSLFSVHSSWDYDGFKMDIDVLYLKQVYRWWKRRNEEPSAFDSETCRLDMEKFLAELKNYDGSAKKDS